jgi:endoglucanase
LVFTGDEFAEGGSFIANELKRQKVKASFFFTGNFYYNPKFDRIVKELARNGHFLGNHSMQHLLYCDWNKRDSLLVTRDQFFEDLTGLNERLGHLHDTHDDNKSLAGSLFYFLPPYEWYNDTISAWTKEAGMQLINFTPGTISHADYTTPEMKNYRSSEAIYNSIINYEQARPAGLNGFMLLMHIGAGSKRTDKFYNRLPELIRYLKGKGYRFQTVPGLLGIH